jgi:uroporphyrin-III C-methyltransferase
MLTPPLGKAYLVGAGPGNVELLTLKAARLIQEADAIVFDHLVGADILALARADARKIYVGKESAKHTTPQESINMMLVALAQEGLQVVRLKGGDPFIFGRGGEELAILASAGISFEVVPGVTAAAGCAAYAGFPLTHRDFAQSVTFVAGHLKDNTVNLDWVALARPKQTIVFYMGVGAACQISQQMQAHGLPGTTPVAVVRNGTLPDQLTLLATLETLPNTLSRRQIKPPALIIVGEVVSLQPQLTWYATEE